MIKRAWLWIFVLFFVIFLGGFTFSLIFKKKVLEVSEAIFYTPRFFFDFFIASRELVSRQKELGEENEALRAKLFNFEKEASLLSIYKRFKYVEAEVYSRYPFNNKDYLIIDRGENEGIKKDFPVTLGEAILIGKVSQTSKYTSEVKTIFNSDWQFGVRIRGEGYDSEALLEGGNAPRLTYIDKKIEIKSGDQVYAVSHEFPLGLKVGVIDEISLSEDSAFREATIILPYNIRDLRKVLVVLYK